jgi:neutral ceramidase
MATLPPLLSGAARQDISPALGTQVDGDIGRYRPTEEIRNPIYVRALVLEQGEEKFCVLSMDLLAVTTEWSDRVRKAIEDECGIPFEAVAVHVTQTHSAPSLGKLMLSGRLPATEKYPWLRGMTHDYAEHALTKIIAAVREARDSARPVLISYAARPDGRVAFNRRYVMRDGSSTMFGRPNEEILHIEGPADPEVGALSLKDENANSVALILHHTSHPTHGYPHRYICPDWPGMWCDLVEPGLSGGMPLVVNGCCGNVHHNNALDPTQVDTADRMAELLNETTQTVISELKPSVSSRLQSMSSSIELPFRDISTEKFENAHALIDENPEPMWLDEEKTRVDWAWCYAASMLDLEEMMSTQDSFEYEVQAVRIGDVAILVLTGEPFVEAQLEIKRRSPAARTYVAHMSNGYSGYIPTPQAIKGGGYETDVCFSSKLAPEALGMIVEESVKVLAELMAYE